MITINRPNKIRDCFNKASETYDTNCQVQLRIAKSLINQVKNYQLSFNKIFDLGCGTGISTKILAETLEYEYLHAVDFAERLLEIARVRLAAYGAIVVESDFDLLDYQTEAYDLIFSNMSFQWSLDLIALIKKIHSILLSDGILAFSIPLSGTFYELNLGHVNQLFTQDKILDILNEIGFTTIYHYSESITNVFDSVPLALHSIKSIGANCLPQSMNKTLCGKSITEKFFKKNEPPYTLTYQIGYFILKK